MATEYAKKMQLRALAKEHFDLTHFPDTFPVASSMPRKFIAYLGPTNSGKTYHAMQALMKSKSGIYAAPLRLLALENYDTMKENGIDVSLVTGDDRRISSTAKHVACTVEMINYSKKVDVAVIDENHMLADPQRGFAWTSAIVGCPASTIYLIAPANAEPAIRALVNRVGGELEVIYTQRKTLLTVEDKPFNFNDIRAGDAFIVFSRRDALAWKEHLREFGHEASTVYGNLSAEVRQAQAKAFREGSVNYLVGTDALSMGLNMPIQRIIFTDTTKFNGKEVVDIPLDLVHQIAGRAGRYGFTEEGHVTAMNPEDLAWIKEQLNSTIPPLPTKGFYVAPTIQQLENMKRGISQHAELSTLLERFQDFANSEDRFFIPPDLSDQIQRAKWIQKHQKLSLEDQFLFCLVPSPINNEWLEHQLKQWVQNYVSGKITIGLDISHALTTFDHFQTKSYPSREQATLAQYEDICKLCSAYAWIAYRKPEAFLGVEAVIEQMKVYSELVDNILRKQKVRERSKNKKNTNRHNSSKSNNR